MCQVSMKYCVIFVSISLTRAEILISISLYHDYVNWRHKFTEEMLRTQLVLGRGKDSVLEENLVFKV
jgi:hypothetical protein